MKTAKKKNFISSIFIGNLIIILIPVTVVAFLINYVLHSYLVNDITQKDEMMLYNVKQNMESFLNEAVDTLEYIDLMADAKSGADMDLELERINNINRHFENIEILDPEGYVSNSLPQNESQIGYNRSGEDYYTYLKKHSDTYWSVPFISSVSGEPTVTVALKEENRIIVGYLNLYHLTLLTDKFTESNPDLKAAVLDGYGIYISNSNTDLVHQRQQELNFSSIKDKSTVDWPGEFMREDRKIGVSVKISDPDWYLIIYDDFTESVKKIDALLYLFIFLIISSVFIFAVITLIRSSRIKKYIDQFIRQTETIASGRFDVVFPDQKYDEFNKLAENFRIMAENLRLRDQELERMAYTDNLTGIKNRAYLYNPGWQGILKDADMLGMIYLDVDNFKNINDSYGHTVGDDLLIAVSRRLQDCLSEKTILLRFGGDEFVIIVPDDNRKEFIHATINNIMGAFKSPLSLGERSIFVTVSMGISVSESKNIDFGTMLKSADIAMYQAKGSGKNNYKFYIHEMDKHIKRRLLIEQNLRNALENNEFSLVYQPQVLAETGKIRGFEALVRWENKELGQVSPLDFIPIAEETGMIVKIGEWILKNACETIREINDRYGTDYIISVNVSPVEINNSFFIKNLYETIAETGIKNEWIEIEITENVFLTSIEEVISIIIHLTSRGIQVSLDDFGTGYSSLSYLNQLPINTLKIDREFIRDLNHNKNNQKMVDSIILLAHKLGMFLIAEGVENQNQLELLEKYSCDCIQGYYMSKPLKSRELLEYVDSQNS